MIDSLDLGGAQAVLVNLIRYGDGSRFAFEVATMHGHGVYWNAVRSLGVPVYSLSFSARFPSYIPAMVWLCLRHRYDIVHTHLIGANVIAKPIAALCGVRVRINHDHCNDKASDSSKWEPKADKFTNRFSTHVIAVSESTRDYVVNEEGFPANRVTTIYNGIDLSMHQPRPERRAESRLHFGLPANAFVVAGVGRLSYQKNFSLFLDVAAGVIELHPNAYFVIAGTGDEDSALKKQAIRLGIESRVKFLGFVAEMPRLYPAVDMLLLTSRYEGLPITILEAMASGAAIVSSKLDGVQEILEDGRDSALVPSDEAPEFVRRVCQLIEQPETVARFRTAALAKVRANFSAEASARAVEAIYTQCLARQA